MKLMKTFTNQQKAKVLLMVRDHCHCTGKFREAAHSIFNLRYKRPK